jgi:hypothetical protein
MPSGVRDERVGNAAQVEQSIPVGIIASETRYLQAEDDADAPETDFSGHVSKAGALHDSGTGDTEVMIDDLDLLARPTQLESPVYEPILTLGRLAVVLDLRHARLANVDAGTAAEMLTADLAGLTHRWAPAEWLRV